MQPAVIGFIEGANPLAVGAAESVEIVTGFRLDIPFQYPGII